MGIHLLTFAGEFIPRKYTFAAIKLKKMALVLIHVNLINILKLLGKIIRFTGIQFLLNIIYII